MDGQRHLPQSCQNYFHGKRLFFCIVARYYHASRFSVNETRLDQDGWDLKEQKENEKETKCKCREDDKPKMMK